MTTTMRTTASATTASPPTDPDAHAHALLAELGGSSLGRPALVFRPALGLRLLPTGHWGVSVANQSHRKASTRSSGPGPFGWIAHGRDCLAERGRRLPQVAVDEGDSDVTVARRVGELPGAGHPWLFHRRLALHAADRPRRTRRSRAGRARLRRTRPPGRGPSSGDLERSRQQRPAGGEEAVLGVEPFGEREELGDDILVIHEVQRHVVERIEQRAARRFGRPAARRTHPALAKRDAVDRELLRHVVELVPDVVGLVGRRIGDLGEREESQH